MPICDAVAANLTTLYLGVIAVMKAYGVIAGRSFSGWFVLSVSTAVVLSILVGSLTWDVSRKARKVVKAGYVGTVFPRLVSLFLRLGFSSHNNIPDEL